MTRKAPAPYWNPTVGGVVLGVVLFLAYLLTGSGLGASGGIARGVLAVEKAVAPDHVDRSAVLSAWGGGTRDPLDHPLVWGVMGVALGGFVSGRLAGRARIETYSGPRVGRRTRWVLALAGGAVMGFAARLARGCTSGQALSGGAVLAVGSWVFMLAVFAGGYAVAWPLRRLWK
ncbi:MAG: YeeE/YedE family protein [Planctomycetes bacterium]|nr:YeeE/YedE family protein [Planctomycetota bacterium]